MPVPIQGVAPGLPPWTGSTIVPTPKGKQKGYWATSGFYLPGDSGVYIDKIGKGFTAQYEFVPEGKVFVLERVAINPSNPNILLGFKVHYYKKGEAYPGDVIGSKYGIREIVYEVGRSRVFEANSRPIYLIYNHSPHGAYVTLNIYGFVEEV